MFKDCMDSCEDAEDVCVSSCLTEAGVDGKQKARLMNKYGKEQKKADIQACIDGGETKKNCMKAQLAGSDGNGKKKVMKVIKDMLFEFVDAAIAAATESDANTTVDEIATAVTAELTDAGFKHADKPAFIKKFIQKTVEKLACDV